ncbi:MAG TPA: hypothetical protein PK728_06180 [Bacillota bacterium]|nr:hypothetical protein [Bacillota bacterium]
MSQKLTISIPDELINVLDNLTTTWKTSRSGVFARLLQEVEKKRLENEMEEGYKTMTVNCADFYLPAQAEAVFLNDKER